MIKGIAHLAFLTSDLEKSKNFYINKLGFKEKFTLYNTDGTPWIVYIAINDDQFIELFPTKKIVFERDKPLSYQHLCLEVDDIYKFVNLIEKKGVEIDQPIITGLDNNLQSWIHDPDENPIELMQYGKDALQLK